jgi:hypothetical protein
LMKRWSALGVLLIVLLGVPGLLPLSTWIVKSQGERSLDAPRNDSPAQSVDVVTVWVPRFVGDQLAPVTQEIDTALGITVEVTSMPTDPPEFFTTVEEAVAAGEGPDLTIGSIAVLQAWAEAGILHPVTTVARDDFIATFGPHLSRYFYPDDDPEGAALGIPLVSENYSLLWYYPPVFEAQSLAPPATWEDLLALSTQFQTPVFAFGDYNVTAWLLNIMALATSAEEAAALHNDAVASGLINADARVHFDLRGTADQIRAGEIGMVFGGHHVRDILQTWGDLKPEDALIPIAFPARNAASQPVTVGLVNSLILLSNKPAAVALLDYAFSGGEELWEIFSGMALDAFSMFAAHPDAIEAAYSDAVTRQIAVDVIDGLYVPFSLFETAAAGMFDLDPNVLTIQDDTTLWESIRQALDREAEFAAAW